MPSFDANPGMTDKDAWASMRQALRIDRAAVDRIKPHAEWARHGGIGSVTDGDGFMLLTTARAIIQRDFDHLQYGRKPFSDNHELVA